MTDSPNTPLKRCSGCQKWLPSTPEHFYRNKKQGSGLTPRCKACLSTTKPKDEIPHGMKRCSKCRQILPATIEVFYFSKVTKDGFGSWCRNCTHLQWRENFVPKRRVDPAPDGFKTCNTCAEVKPSTTEFFYADKTVRCGLSTQCRVCHAKAGQQNYLNHLKERRTAHLEYGRVNKMRFVGYHKVWYQENKDRILAQQADYNASHREQQQQYWKSYAQRPDVKVRRRAKLRHRRLMRQANGSHTDKDIQQQYERQHGHCYYCKCNVKWGEHHVDHIVPLSRGGSDNPDNLVIACAPCNLSKGDKLLHEWKRGGRLL